MSRKILNNDIQVLIDMIREQSAIIATYEGKIPQIEIDIVMTNIRKLYEDYMELSKLNGQYRPEKKEEPQMEEPRERELVKVIKKEEEVAPTIIHEKPKEQFQQKKIKSTKPIDLFAESDNHTLADSFKNQAKSTHEKIIDGSKDKTLADTIRNPISDLKTGIGVNDRFLLINELFKGVMADYEEAIIEINGSGGLEEALEKMQELKESYGWASEADAYNKLESFIRRRFAE
jgi:hypothetical protein